MQLKQGFKSVNGHWFLKFRWQFIPPNFHRDHPLILTTNVNTIRIIAKI